MKKIIIIDVDEDRLRNIEDDITNTDDTVNGLISQEFGWLSQSGISIVDIDYFADDGEEYENIVECKEDYEDKVALVNRVMSQIHLDLDDGCEDAVGGFLMNVPTSYLLSYLPFDDTEERRDFGNDKEEE